jgi:hypothetical protein
MEQGKMPVDQSKPEIAKLMFEKDIKNLRITAKAPDNSTIQSQTVEALLLFDIRDLLQKVVDGLIDVETAVESKS